MDLVVVVPLNDTGTYAAVYGPFDQDTAEEVLADLVMKNQSCEPFISRLYGDPRPKS